MHSRLYARATGDLRPAELSSLATADLLRSFAPAPWHRFDGDDLDPDGPVGVWAHRVGVNALALDKFDGRWLLSGGADGTIKLWDLEDASNPHTQHTFRPRSKAIRAPTNDETSLAHKHGVTSLAFYPFDSEAFLSGSFDKSVKLWSTRRMAVSATFDLNAIIYDHATSPIADHLLVACATQHSAVRLVDLRSGSAVQSLVAHGGAVLSVAWSPRQEHLLASGHVDGRVRMWDIRRAGGIVAMLDQEDNLGVLHRFSHTMSSSECDWSERSHFRVSARAHDEGVNGLCWTDDGRYVVSAGLDSRIRVWDADTGANTLSSFGSAIQNRQPGTVGLFTSPSNLSTTKSDFLFWPNDQEILVLDLHEGTLVTRLRVAGSSAPATSSTSSSSRQVGSSSSSGLNMKNRTMSMVWRGAGGHGLPKGAVMGGGSSFGSLYTAHLDGQIRAWMPRLAGPDADDPGEDPLDEDEESRKRKRKAIDDAYRSLMGKQITFS